MCIQVHQHGHELMQQGQRASMGREAALTMTLICSNDLPQEELRDHSRAPSLPKGTEAAHVLLKHLMAVDVLYQIPAHKAQLSSSPLRLHYNDGSKMARWAAGTKDISEEADVRVATWHARTPDGKELLMHVVQAVHEWKRLTPAWERSLSLLHKEV